MSAKVVAGVLSTDSVKRRIDCEDVADFSVLILDTDLRMGDRRLD